MLLETTLAAAFFVGTLHAIRIEIYLMVAAAGLAAMISAGVTAIIPPATSAIGAMIASGRVLRLLP